MNKLKLVCLASLLATGVAHALTPCNGFIVKVKNNLNEDLTVTSATITGAKFQNGDVTTIAANSAHEFIVTASAENTLMNGVMKLTGTKATDKSANIQFTLNNFGLICQHRDESPKSDYKVSKVRLPGTIHYKVGK